MLSTDIQNCILRPWTPGDKPALIRLADNRKVWRNLTALFPSPYTEPDADFWIGYSDSCSPSIHLAIEVDGVAAGGIGIDAGKGVSCYTGHFGYWLGEHYWGKGFATAAARSLVSYALENLPFARLEASVFEWNPASMRVLDKAGFTREGVLRRSVYKDGQLIDVVMYARIRDV